MLVFMRFRKSTYTSYHTYLTQNETSVIMQFQTCMTRSPKVQEEKKSHTGLEHFWVNYSLNCAGTSAPVLSWQPPSGSSSFPVVACPPLFSGPLDLTPYGSDEKTYISTGYK